MDKVALITGAWGQDGVLLAESLLNKGYQILGVGRPNSSTSAPQHLKPVKELHFDLTDLKSVQKVFREYSIHECYHLAACHHESTKNEVLSLEKDSEMILTNFKSTENLIRGILESGNKTKLFYAGSSQMFTPSKYGEVFSEKSHYNPSTFYGHTKVFSANLIDYYRKKHGLFGVTGILFNHESPLRPPKFISRLITSTVAKISKGIEKKLEVRNPYGVTDWSSAKDFVEGYQLALSQREPEDLIFSSGKQHQVQDIINISFNYLNLNVSDFLSYPETATPPASSIIGDNSKLLKLGWKQEYSFQKMIIEMLEQDLKEI